MLNPSYPGSHITRTAVYDHLDKYHFYENISEVQTLSFFIQTVFNYSTVLPPYFPNKQKTWGECFQNSVYVCPGCMYSSKYIKNHEVRIIITIILAELVREVVVLPSVTRIVKAVTKLCVN